MYIIIIVFVFVGPIIIIQIINTILLLQLLLLPEPRSSTHVQTLYCAKRYTGIGISSVAVCP